MKIQLTIAERKELAARSYVPFGQEPTIAAFWRSLLAARGILPKARSIPVTMPTDLPGEFLLEWHPRALGPKAITAGHEYRRFAEGKDAKFQEKLRREGRVTPASHWR